MGIFQRDRGANLQGEGRRNRRNKGPVYYVSVVSKHSSFNSKHLLSHRSCGSGIWVWLSWVPWPKSSESCSYSVSLPWGRSASELNSWLLASPSLLALPGDISPCHMCLSIGQLTTRPGSLQSEQAKREPGCGLDESHSLPET